MWGSGAPGRPQPEEDRRDVARPCVVVLVDLLERCSGASVVFFVLMPSQRSAFSCVTFCFFFKQKTAYEISECDGVQTCALPIRSESTRLTPVTFRNLVCRLLLEIGREHV